MNLIEYINHDISKHIKNVITYVEKPNIKNTNFQLPKTTDTSIHSLLADHIFKPQNHNLNYIVRLKDCSVVSHNNAGSISLYQEDIKIEDFSTAYEFPITSLNTIELSGTSILLSADSCSNYFHWLCQILPRINLLISAGVNLSRVDHILIPQIRGDFVVETLQVLGVPIDLSLIHI